MKIKTVNKKRANVTIITTIMYRYS